MITQKDEELIALLRLNAREPVASLARKLGVSRTTVQDRLKRLEQQGVIAGYGLKLSSELNRGGICAFVTLKIEPRQSAGVTRNLTKIAQIETIYTVSGKFDVVALVRALSAEEMDRLLDNIGMIPGILRTDSAVILSTKLDRR